MANSVEGGVVSFDSALDESLKFLAELGMSRELRMEQKVAISSLVSGKDLLAVLPTGFGKSLIFQMLVLIKQIMTGKPSSAVVVCPLQSIIYDQLAEASSMGLTAAALTDCRLEEIESGKYQLIFASAEEVLSKPFLSSLKKTASLFHQNMCAIIVDESHTVETWTGQRFVPV